MPWATFLIRSWSSTTPNSRPVAWAIRFPATRLPTSMEAGPTSTGRIRRQHSLDVSGAGRQTDRQTHAGRGPTWLFLPGFGHVGYAGVGAHEDVAGVQVSFQEALLGFTDVDSSQRRLGKCVGRHQSKAVQPHLVDAVDGLREETGFFVLFWFAASEQASERNFLPWGRAGNKGWPAGLCSSTGSCPPHWRRAAAQPRWLCARRRTQSRRIQQSWMEGEQSVTPRI